MKRVDVQRRILRQFFQRTSLFSNLWNLLPKKKINMILPFKIAIGSGVLLIFILIFGWAAFPGMLKGKIKSVDFTYYNGIAFENLSRYIRQVTSPPDISKRVVEKNIQTEFSCYEVHNIKENIGGSNRKWRCAICPFKFLIKMVNLKPGTDLRGMYMDIPFPLTFKVFVFNITNPNEVTNGAIPIVQEVGPYVYEEKRQKVLVNDNEDEDTMTFLGKDSFYFKPELSSPLTGEELITIPHPMIVAIVLTVLKQKPAMINLINKALNSIHNNPQTPFLTATYNQIFFDGVIINCTVTDFPGKAVCTQLRTEAKDLVHITENIFKFSLFGPKNATLGTKYKVKRGIKNYRDTGRLVELNDEPELKIWGSKECNQYHGTEGTIFPALTPPGSDILSFAAAFCRTIVAKYSGKTKYDGIPVSIYKADFGDMSSPEEKCYCSEPEDICWKKGVIDLTKCAAPIIVSLPHFYDCDESYIRGVKGISPNQEDHEIRLLFETMTSSPVSARNRVQFSMQILPVDKISSMKKLPDTLVPMFWVEESVDLNNTFTGPIKTLYKTMKIVKIVSWIFVVGSIGGLVAAGYLYYAKRSQLTITPVKTVKAPVSHISTVHGNSVDDNNGGVTNHAMSGHTFDKY